MARPNVIARLVEIEKLSNLKLELEKAITLLEKPIVEALLLTGEVSDARCCTEPGFRVIIGSALTRNYEVYGEYHCGVEHNQCFESGRGFKVLWKTVQSLIP